LTPEQLVARRIKMMQTDSAKNLDDSGLAGIIRFLSEDAHSYFTQKQISKRIAICEKGTALEPLYMDLFNIFETIEMNLIDARKKFYELEAIKEEMRNVSEAAKPKSDPSNRREGKQDLAKRETVCAGDQNERDEADSINERSKRSKSISPVLANIRKRKK